MNGTVYSLAMDHNGSLYGGGGFAMAGGVGANHSARWDGSVWSALGSGLNGPVYALAVDNRGNLYASGSFSTAGGRLIGKRRIELGEGGVGAIEVAYGWRDIRSLCEQDRSEGTSRNSKCRRLWDLEWRL